MTFHIYSDTAGYWRWNLVAANNRMIANSGEGYFNKNDCLAAIGLIMDTNRSTPIYNT